MPKIKFFKIAEQPGSNKLAPEVSEVFADNVEENGEWFLPLMTVDLKAVNPEWSGKVHFVYNEANMSDGVTFKLHADKYVYEGEYDFDEGDMAGRDRKQGFLELVELEVDDFDDASQFDWLDETNDKIYAINEKETGDQFEGIVPGKNYFGLKPWWVTFDETPNNPDGEPMKFVGQITAMEFSDEVGDYDMYLFYDPKHQIVTQIQQCT